MGYDQIEDVKVISETGGVHWLLHGQRTTSLCVSWGFEVQDTHNQKEFRPGPFLCFSMLILCSKSRVLTMNVCMFWFICSTLLASKSFRRLGKNCICCKKNKNKNQSVSCPTLLCLRYSSHFKFLSSALNFPSVVCPGIVFCKMAENSLKCPK